MKTIRCLIRHPSGTVLLLACLAAVLPLQADPPTLVAPDGKHTASVNSQGHIVYREEGKDSAKSTFYACNIQALAFSRDSQLLAAGGGRNGNPGKIKVWRLKDAQQLCEITTHQETIAAVALSDDGVRVVAASLKGRLESWRVADGAIQWTRTFSAPIESIQFNPDRHQLEVRLSKGREFLLDPATGRPVPPPETSISGRSPPADSLPICRWNRVPPSTPGSVPTAYGS